MSFGGHHDYVLHKNVALKVVSSFTLSVHIFGVAGDGISQCQISGLESSLYRQLWCHMSAHVGTCRHMLAHVGTCRQLRCHMRPVVIPDETATCRVRSLRDSGEVARVAPGRWY
jgi:hypothetical protein